MVFITLRKITGKYIEITMSFSLFVCNSCFNKASNFNNISLFLSIFSIFLSSSFQKNIYDITLQIDYGISKGTICITYMYRGILMSVCVSMYQSVCLYATFVVQPITFLIPVTSTCLLFEIKIKNVRRICLNFVLR